jgi:hypothetical protein
MINGIRVGRHTILISRSCGGEAGKASGQPSIEKMKAQRMWATQPPPWRHPSIGDKNMRHSTSRPRPHTPKIFMNASLVSVGVSETSARTCTSVALWLIKSCQKKLTKQSQSRQRASETRWWRLPQRHCGAGPVLVLVHRVSGRTVWSHQSACRRADRNLARRRRDRWLIRLHLRVYLLAWHEYDTAKQSGCLADTFACLYMWCFRLV